jgi:hypothetical protein
MSVSVDAKAVATALIDAIGARDFEAIEACFAEDARMRALVPGRLRDEEGPGAIAARMRFWWDETEGFELLQSEIDAVGDHLGLRYRLRWKDPELGWCDTEQAAYLAVEDSRIAALDLVCSGSRPVAAAP